MSGFDKVLGSASLFFFGSYFGVIWTGTLDWWIVLLALSNAIFALFFLIQLFTKEVS